MNNSVEGLQKFEEWVINLPKTLWELGGTNLPCTEVVPRLAVMISPLTPCLGNPSLSAAAISAPFSYREHQRKYSHMFKDAAMDTYLPPTFR